jgi:hypothetical protein
MKKLVITFVAVVLTLALQSPVFGQAGGMGLLGVGRAPGGGPQSASLVQLSPGDNTYTSLGLDGSSAATSYQNSLPNGTTTGNSLVAVLIAQDNAGTITPSDNIGGNTYTLDCSVDDSTNARKMWVYRIAAPAAGTQTVTMGFATGKKWAVLKLYEFQHLGSLDGACVTHVSTGGTMTAGSYTPGAVGDYLLNITVNDTDDTISHFGQSSQSSWSVQMLDSDTIVGNSTNAFENATATQGGAYTSASAINPQMTQTGGSTNGYISVALGYSQGSSGGPAPSTNYIVGIHHYLINIGAADASMTIDYPCQGTNQLVQYNGGGTGTGLAYDYVNITDSSGHIWPEVGVENPTADGNNTRQIYYLGGTCSGSTTLTLALSDNLGLGGTFVSAVNLIIYDFNGTWAFDKAGYNSGTQASSGNVTGVSITPSAANEMFFTNFVNDKGYPNGFSGSGAFDSVVWGNMPYSNGVNTNADELSGHGHFYNTTSSAYQPVWTSGSSTNYNQWSTVNSAFGAAGSSSKTWTLVQSQVNASCGGSTTCTISGLSALGSGHLLVVMAYLNGTNNGVVRVRGVSAGCSDPWKYSIGVQAHDTNSRASSGTYCLTSASGATSVTVTAEDNSASFPNNGWGVSISEFSYTGTGPVQVDEMAGQNDTACTSCSVASMGTLRGSSDVICYEFNTPSGITAPGSPYTVANNLGTMGSVCAINTTTQLSTVSQGSSATIAEGGIAFY